MINKLIKYASQKTLGYLRFNNLIFYPISELNRTKTLYLWKNPSDQMSKNNALMVFDQ